MGTIKTFKFFLISETKIYDDSYTNIQEVIDAFKDGQLLVHARHKDGTDFRYGIDPSAGELLKSTDAYQTYEDEEYLPELIFFSDEDFSWGVFKQNGGRDVEYVFVEKNETIVQYIGNGKIKTHNGEVMVYERCYIASYDSPAYRSVPLGVETNDWFTNESQDVVAVIDYKDIKDFL